YRVDEKDDRGKTYGVRRHPVYGRSERSEQHPRVDRSAAEVRSEPPAGSAHLEGPDHPGVAEILDPGPRADRPGAAVQVSGRFPVAFQDPLFLDRIEDGERGAAGERAAAVRMRQQKAPPQRVLVESLLDPAPRPHDPQRPR